MGCAGEAACRPAVECYRRRQTPATVTSLAPYTMYRRASNDRPFIQYATFVYCKLIQLLGLITELAGDSDLLLHARNTEYRGLTVCLSVCVGLVMFVRLALRNGINRSRCRLGADSCGPKEPLER